MRDERGTLPGGLVVFEPLTLWGSVGGDVTVVSGGKFYLRGAVYGNLIAEAGGRVHIFGSVTGNLLVHEDAKVIHSGVLAGNATNNGGRMYFDATAKVGGKIKTRSGKTRIDPACKFSVE